MRILAMLALLTTCSHLRTITTDADLAQNLLKKTLLIESPYGEGSGFMISDSIAVTARHVVEESVEHNRAPEIETEGGHTCEVHKATLVGDFDLAFLTVEGCEDIEIVKIADYRPEIGQTVVGTGHPLHTYWVFTEGAVTGNEGDFRGSRALKFDAPIYKGMSGGPLVDKNGYLLGVIVGMKQKRGVWLGVSYAVHAKYVIEYHP